MITSSDIVCSIFTRPMVHGLAIAQNRQCQLFLFEVEHKPLHSKKTNRHFHDDENCTESKKKKKLLNVKELDLVFMVQFTRKKKKESYNNDKKINRKKVYHILFIL